MVSDNIKKYKSRYIILFGIVFVVCALVWLSQPRLDIAQPVEKTLRFTYTLKNTANEFIPQADFVAMIPVEIAGAQHIVSITTTEKYELINKGAFNQAIKFTIQNFPPFATKIIGITMVLNVDALAKEDSIKKNPYLIAEKYIETDSLAVKEIAAQLVNKRSELTAKSIYEWLVNNIKDVGYVAENKGAEYAVEKRVGDCTEHMYAFVALARVNGIPARGVAGFVVPNSAAILNSADYHNWAEFFDGKKWILVDSQKHVFDAQYENYIVTRVLDNKNDSVMSSNRFLMTDSRIKVSL